jgi:hypothetical protein
VIHSQDFLKVLNKFKFSLGSEDYPKYSDCTEG